MPLISSNEYLRPWSPAILCKWKIWLIPYELSADTVIQVIGSSNHHNLWLINISQVKRIYRVGQRTIILNMNRILFEHRFVHKSTLLCMLQFIILCMYYSFCIKFIPESEFITQMKFRIYLKIIFIVTRCSLANYRPCETNSTAVKMDCDHRVSESGILATEMNLWKVLQYLIKPQNKITVKCDRSWLFSETCSRQNQSEIQDQNSGITILFQPNQDLACCTEDEACEMVSAGDKTCEDLPYFENFVGERTC